MSQQAILRPLRHWPWLLHFHHHHHPTSSTKFSALYHHLLLPPTSSPESTTNIRRFSLSASRGKLRRADSPLPTAPEEQADEDAAIKSRNQLKREAKRAVKWGIDLSSFSPPQIKRILRFVFSSFIMHFSMLIFQKFQLFAKFCFWATGWFLWTKLSLKLLCWLRFLPFLCHLEILIVLFVLVEIMFFY